MYNHKEPFIKDKFMFINTSPLPCYTELLFVGLNCVGIVILATFLLAIIRVTPRVSNS